MRGFDGVTIPRSRPASFVGWSSGDEIIISDDTLENMGAPHYSDSTLHVDSRQLRYPTAEPD